MQLLASHVSDDSSFDFFVDEDEIDRRLGFCWRCVSGISQARHFRIQVKHLRQLLF